VTRLNGRATIGKRPVNSGLNSRALRRARAADWGDVSRLLDDAELPVTDLGPALLEHFLIAELDDDVVGLVGLEVFGTTGLLRSLVVAKRARSAGLGGKLVAALEAAAQAAGVRELWLLTIDAENFFIRHGYDVVTRDAVPDAIRLSKEFAELCPDSACLMLKDLSADKS